MRAHLTTTVDSPFELTSNLQFDPILAGPLQLAFYSLLHKFHSAEYKWWMPIIHIRSLHFEPVMLYTINTPVIVNSLCAESLADGRNLPAPSSSRPRNFFVPATNSQKRTARNNLKPATLSTHFCPASPFGVWTAPRCPFWTSALAACAFGAS